MLQFIIVYQTISPRILALAVHFWCLYNAPFQQDMIHLKWRP